MVARDSHLQGHWGFTLIELLVVVLIIGLVSVLALPTILPALAARQVSESGRLVQAALAGARDQAIRTGQPSGIRLLPDTAWPLAYTSTGTIDPTAPLAYGRLLPIESAPEYAEGLVTVRAGAAYANAIRNPAGANVSVPSLVLEQSPTDATGLIASPTSWAWNVRVGDRLQLNGAGPWYTVVGPCWNGPGAGNTEMFVNWGPAGVTSPLGVEWLVLVNGRDDDSNGWVDEGWDGVDNDTQLPDQPPPPGLGIIDDAGEWEPEAWQGAAAKGVVAVPYTIRRRPLPGANARELALPTAMVVDAARSSLPINPYTGAVEIMVNPDGTAGPSLPYGVPSSLGMGSAFMHLALLNREDVAPVNPPPAPKKGWAVLSLQLGTGRVVVIEDPDPASPFLAAMRGSQ